MVTIDKTHSMSEYLDLLSTSLEIYMDNDRLTSSYEEVCYTTDDMRNLASMWLRIESAGLYPAMSPDNIIDFLCRIGVDMEKRYANKKTKSLSLDIKRVVIPLIEAGVAPELLTAYKEYRSYRSYASSMSKLIESKRMHGHTSSGRTIVKFPTHIEERDNLRVYYNNISVVSVPKLYSKMITGPTDSHFIAWCDYPQADWRFAYNLFIRDENNFKVMSSCDDAYEGLARLIEGDSFDLAVFKEKRKEYKVHCLKVFYNSKDKAQIPSAIREFFRSCPKYKKLLFDLEVFYHFKLPIPCTSYFGFEQLLPEGTYPDAFISKGLNTPIQTFTSHIVNETVFKVLEMFWSLGYTKEQANVYYVRHDEPLFLFTRDVLKDSWIFDECSEISIPGFTPIHLDFHFGEYYQEEDEDLTREVDEAKRQSGFVPTRYSMGKAKDYWPFPTVEYVYAQFYGVENSGFDVVVHNYRTQESATFYGVGSEPLVALKSAMNSGMLDWLGSPEYLLARTNGFDDIDYVGPEDSTLLRVIDRYDSNINPRR